MPVKHPDSPTSNQAGSPVVRWRWLPGLDLHALNTRLTMLLMVMSILPILLFGWFAHAQLLDRIKAERIAIVGEIANGKYNQLHQLLTLQQTRADAALSNLALHCLVTTGKLDTRCAKTALQTFLETERATGLTLRDAEATALFTVGQPLPEAATRHYQPGQLAQLHGAGLQRTYTVSLSHPASGLSLTINYPASLLQNLLTPAPETLGASGETFLTDGQGYFVTPNRYPAAQGHSHPIAARPMRACLQGKTAQVLAPDYRGAEIIHGFHYVPDFGGGCIMAHTAQEEAFAPIKTLDRIILTLAVLLALTALAFAWRYTRSISIPLAKLSAAFRHVAAGDAVTRVLPPGITELNELSGSFNSMAERLDAAKLEQQQLERTLHFIAQQGWYNDGERFLQAVARYLAELLEVDFVLIGKLDDPQTINTALVWCKGGLADNFSYALHDTPCENVVGKTLCCYPQHVRQLFPRDHLLVEMGIESYVGIPLYNTACEPLGLLAVMHSQPLQDRMELIRTHLQLVASRIAAEIQRQDFLESIQLSALALENSSEGMLITDEKNCIVAVNPAFTSITGYTLDEVRGKNPRILQSGRHDKAFYQAMWQALLNNGHWQGEVWDRRKNGEIHAKFLNINTIGDEQGNIHRFVALFSDITEKKRSEELIWKQANFDTLTGLPNRSLFRDRLEHEITLSQRSGLPLALLMIDLDKFKEVNDTLGHDQGDLLLQQATQRITACVRDSDTVARLGGDEFTVVLSQLADIDQADVIAQKILNGLTQPFLLGAEQVFISGSVGITLYPHDADDISTLMKNADQAMYLSKQQGRSRFSYFTHSLQEAALKRKQLLGDMRVALSEHQFRAYYQPIVNLQTGVIHKAEALVRWLHPQRGLVSPIEFIPLAEETGLIVELGDFMFRQAAQQAAHWKRHFNTDFQISVNRSPVQFRQAGQDDTAASLQYLQQLNLAGSAIVIEITEGLLLDAAPAVSGSLLQMRDAGIQVALDDFGTGYSSLSYLQKFDIDYLKIDKSFVDHLALRQNTVALCEAIIVMAHKLGMKVIAEGVETEQQRDILKAIGCDYGQGYLFSRPVPADEFERLLTATASPTFPD